MSFCKNRLKDIPPCESSKRQPMHYLEAREKENGYVKYKGIKRNTHVFSGRNGIFCVNILKILAPDGLVVGSMYDITEQFRAP